MALPSTVDQWLTLLEQRHSKSIDLGLDRVATVWRQLGSPRPAPIVITVAGTNGKGSTAALLASILTVTGKRCGVYSSPHLVRFNERIAINGTMIADADLLQSFAAVEAARGAVSLSYFEFTTLAAVCAMRSASLDVAIMEVGLGGRLDAVNVIDADAAIVTSIALDHADWLGSDLEQIGREKAGVFRPARAAVGSAPQLPQSVAQHATSIGALWRARNEHFFAVTADGHWTYRSACSQLSELPLPALAGAHQVDNAAGALAALEALALLPARSLVAKALQDVMLPGRQQIVEEQPLTIVDVAHNPAAAVATAATLARDYPEHSVQLVLGMLADKDAKATADALAQHLSIAHWHLVDLESPRGLRAADLAAMLPAAAGATQHRSVEEGLQAASREALKSGAMVLIAGSFLTAGRALAGFGTQHKSGSTVEDHRKDRHDAFEPL